MDLSRMNIFKSVQIKIDTTKNGMYKSTDKRKMSIIKNTFNFSLVKLYGDNDEWIKNNSPRF